MIKYRSKIDGLCYVEDMLDKDGRKIAKVIFDNQCSLISDANAYLKEQRGIKLSGYNSINMRARDICHFHNFILVTGLKVFNVNKERIIDFIKYLTRIDSGRRGNSIENSLLVKIPWNHLEGCEKVKKINTFGMIDSKSIRRILRSTINYLQYLKVTKRQLIHDDISKIDNTVINKLMVQAGIAIDFNEIEPVDIDMILSAKQIDAIMSEAAKNNDYQTILYYILEKTGMRIGEALGLQITYYDRQNIRNLEGDIYFKNDVWCIKIVFRGSNPVDSLAKGHKPRDVYIDKLDTQTFEQYLRKYLAFRERKVKSKKNNWFFISNSAKKLTQNTAYVRFKRNLDKSLTQDSNHLTLHTWRHTYCSNALLKGVPLEVVAKQVGHKSPLTTFLIYVHNTWEEMLEVRKKYEHYIEPALRYLQRRSNKWTI